MSKRKFTISSLTDVVLTGCISDITQASVTRIFRKLNIVRLKRGYTAIRPTGQWSWEYYDVQINRPLLTMVIEPDSCRYDDTDKPVRTTVCEVCGEEFKTITSCVLCPSCRRMYEGVPPKRKCHDCGKPTYNYRCAACQEAFYRLNSVEPSLRVETGFEG